MKRALAFIILIFFLFNSMGYYLLFEFDKYMVKKMMKVFIQKDPVHLIILKIVNADGNHDFRRIDDHEIEYKGKLYDFVREIEHGHTSVFICLHDSREESLFAGLKKAQFHKLLLALWDHIVKIAFPDSTIIVENISFAELIFPHITISLKSSLLSTWSPPPEISLL